MYPAEVVCSVLGTKDTCTLPIGLVLALCSPRHVSFDPTGPQNILVCQDGVVLLLSTLVMMRRTLSPFLIERRELVPALHPIYLKYKDTTNDTLDGTEKIINGLNAQPKRSLS